MALESRSYVAYRADLVLQGVKQEATALIPWSDLEVSTEEAIQGDLPVLEGKIALVGITAVRVLGLLRTVELLAGATKDALDRGVQHGLGAREDKGTVAGRTAALFAGDDELDYLQRELHGLETRRRVLQGQREALDMLWRTLSRLISARMYEPPDDHRTRSW